MALRARPGFSLIELFTVLAVVAILVALAVPRLHEFKHRYYQATLLSDLRNLASTEEAYYSAVDQYTNDLAALKFVPTELVTITFAEADSTGWSAKAVHANDTITCSVYYGNAAILAPATAKSIIACN
jgi:prepilin-type N-terminal cleavage/methylation domain-containing protein